MFNQYSPTYSIQPAGQRARVLVTTQPKPDAAPGSHAPAPVPAQTTQALVTLDPQVAATVAADLNLLVDLRPAVLMTAAQARPGKVCRARRAVMAYLAGTRRSLDEATGAPAEGTLTELAGILATLSDAERRAVIDEVGRIFDGTEDIPVPARLTDEVGGPLYDTLANDYLDDVDDDEVRELLTLIDPFDDHYLLYEGLLAQLREADQTVDRMADNEWVDVWIDTKALEAWLRHHHPELAEEIDEIVSEED